MPRPEFSEMLVERRRELGLSIQQASRVLRLREEVLQAFEDGDWRRMPQGGYAQGMLSSYARYLGLDAKTVVDQYAADLYDATHAPARGSSRRQREGRSASTASSAGRGRMQDHGAAARHGAPASGRAASGGVRRASDAGRGSRHEAEAPRMRRYTSREGMERHGGSAARGRTMQARASRRGAAAVSDPEFDRYGAGPGRIERRRVEADEYVDDLRYDDRAESYEAASSYDGRMSSRNIAQVSRPNVRRQPSRERQRERSRAPQKTKHDGFLGFLEAFFSDGRRTMIFIMVVVGIILTVVIIGSVSSCVSAQSSTGRSTVDVSTSDSEGSSSGSSDSSSDGSSDSSDSSSDADRQQAAAEATAKRQAQEEQEANTETKVKVGVADGQVSWVEIDCDGTSEVAETITGPWEKEYTVTDSITIQVSDTTAVTVTKNGETQKIEGKASGIGSITIEGTNPQAASSDSSDSSDSASSGSGSADGSSSKSSSGSSSDAGSSSSSSASSSKKTSSASGSSKSSN